MALLGRIVGHQGRMRGQDRRAFDPTSLLTVAEQRCERRSRADHGSRELLALLPCKRLELVAMTLIEGGDLRDRDVHGSCQ
ncbi:MAG TPA: hypothetical protein VGG05_03585 [Pseudonocardiaceae bacterium]